MSREKVALEPNVPETLQLKYGTGKMMEDRGYGPSVMYTTADDRVLFVDPECSLRIMGLGLAAGESMTICKQVRKGQKARYDVALSLATEKMRAAKAMPPEPPTELEEQIAGSLENIKEGKHPAAPRMPAAVARRLQATTETEPQQRGTGTNGPVPMQRATPIKATYGAALMEFLLMAGRATSEAESKLAAEGVTLRVDSRDVVALATTCFIQAAREGFITWRPGECE